MKLATASEVVARLNLGNTIGGTDTGTIDSALEGATPILESLLRTPLAETDRTDYFDYTVSAYGAFVPFDVWLNQRFLSGNVYVYNTTDGNPITDLGSATLLDSSYYTVDSERGRLFVVKTVNTGYSALAVRYTAGYAEGSSDIPAWLKEAAISTAIALLHIQSIAHGKKDTKDMSPHMSRMVYQAVNEHIVTPFGGVHPSRTQVN